MANIYFQLQLTSMAHHREVFSYVCPIDSRQGIHQKQQCRCLPSSIGWRVIGIMERGGCMGYLSSHWVKKVYSMHYIDLGNTCYLHMAYFQGK
jgi:hypothetical protein